MAAESPQASEQAQPERPGGAKALVFPVRDAIGPATSDYFVRTLKSAPERGAALVIVEMDTPGGLDTAMRDMIQAVLASPVPVVTYVSPAGARAASAGTYLMYASHVAAMAPATNLGAATPVPVGGGAEPPASPQPADEPEGTSPQDGKEKSPQGGPSGKPPEPASSAERKAVNDAVAYIRGLAELRGRNADWAEAAVRSGASLSASAALEQGVIDLIARDHADLLRQLDGRRLQIADQQIELDTAGMTLERVEPDWRTELLSVLTNPNVAYLLMLIGIYGLLLEGYNPGALLPGVAGAICLLLALYAFQVLSVNYAGLGLILLGLVLIVAEAFAPSFGALGLGGILAFVIGSIILMDSDVPGYQVNRQLIGAIAFVGAGAALGMVTYFMRARRRAVVTGVERMLAEQAVALTDFDGQGQVRVRGEIWNAVSPKPVRAGQVLRITRVDGLTLEVEP